MLNKILTDKKIVLYTLIIYWISLFVATSVPTNALPSFGISDKFEHMGAFFILTFLMNLYFLLQTNESFFSKFPFISVLIISVLYAAFDEIHQYFIPGRYCELYDFFADIIGIGVALLFFNLIVKKRIKFSST